MSTAAIVELQEVLRNKETQAVISSARTHPATETSKRLLRLAALAEVILREVEAEAVLVAEGEGKGA